MQVSACVIVKNEAHNLSRWLRCMQALADEIVVGDTGSTDETVAIAEAAGARVAHFTWCQDFAAAKNYAIDQTTGDWVLLLDADEYFPEAQWPAVRAALARYDAQYEVIGLICDWLNFDEDRDNAPLSAGYQIRMFRRLPDLRYERAIHEALCYRGHEHRIFQYVPGLAIYHTGYSTQRGQGKVKRNLAILQARMASGEGTSDDEFYLVDCYASLGEWEQVAYHAARVARAQGLSNWGDRRRRYKACSTRPNSGSLSSECFMCCRANLTGARATTDGRRLTTSRPSRYTHNCRRPMHSRLLPVTAPRELAWRVAYPRMRRG